MTDTLFHPETTILQLGDAFYDAVQPACFPRHVLRFRNQRWAKRVGLGDLEDADWVRHMGQFAPLPGSLSQPLALRYHGHQFRTYNPDIGDGRGFLFAQLRDSASGRLLDLGTKGSGQTPYSRFGDGRLTLKGGVREVLATEMLEARGVNTSKTFSLIETGEALQRNDEPSPTRSAVMVRLSHSHIRYGMFQRLAYFDQKAEMARLVDYCLTHLLDSTLPQTASLEDKVSRLMELVVPGAARLAASYMGAGFVHGVLNTDNINITGESFDYGPYRFAPTYDLQFTAAYFDQFGLYAFGRQGEALHWNVYQLAKALLTIVAKEVVIPALEGYPAAFEAGVTDAILQRLGLRNPGNAEQTSALMAAMERGLTETGMSLDGFYFDWFGGPASGGRAMQSSRADVYTSPVFADFRQAIARFQPKPEATRALETDYFRGAEPCSLLIDEIEAIWSAIDERDDWSAFNDKIEAIRAMAAR